MLAVQMAAEMFWRRSPQTRPQPTAHSTANTSCADSPSPSGSWTLTKLLAIRSKLIARSFCRPPPRRLSRSPWKFAAAAGCDGYTVTGMGASWVVV